MIKNVVFDIGNVLVAFDWKNHYKNLGYDDEMVERLARATVYSDDWGEYDRGVLTQEEIVNRFIKNDPEIEADIRRVNEDFADLLPVYEYSKGMLLDLKKQGFCVYALSNMSHKAVNEAGGFMDLLLLMDGYILSCDVKLIKPDHEIYKALYEKYKLNPQETVFFDDTEKNIVAAKETGMHGIIFKDVKSAITEFNELVKKENTGGKFESKYTKGQRIGATVCVGIIVLLYLTTLLLTFINRDWANHLVKISLGCTLVLPCLTWVYIWMIGKLTHKRTIADFNFFENVNDKEQ